MKDVIALKLKLLFIIILIFAQSGLTISAAQEDLSRKIREYLLAKNVSGSIAIVKNNKLLYQEGIGFANRRFLKANQPETTFPIGSITKTIVAVSILQLQEKGKLSIEDTVAKYIPDFPNGGNIKLMHLLNHTSGIQATLLPKGEPEEMVKGIKNGPIKFPAGSEWDYNDSNYLVLGYISEKVSGEPLQQYIEKNIFLDAGMKHSGFITAKNPVPYTSTGYYRAGSHWLQAKRLTIPQLFGCGNIYATALDICLFDKALMSGKLISKNSLQTMLTRSSKSTYGLGLYIQNNRFYSRGILGGWETLHVYYKDDTAVTILLNVYDKKINIHQLADDIYKMVNSV